MEPVLTKRHGGPLIVGQDWHADESPTLPFPVLNETLGYHARHAPNLGLLPLNYPRTAEPYYAAT